MSNEGPRPPGDDGSAEKQYCTGHTPESLSGFGSSYGLISEGPVEGRTAAVFAHGFTGDSHSTWQRFQTMIDEQQAMYPNFARWDIYFYDYRSLYGDIAVLAPAFVKFVHELYPRPQPKLFTIADPRIPEKYDNLILVGHSLGAVLIRQAMLDIVAPRGFDDVNLDYLGTADRNILGATLKLFAPATFGFNPTHLAGYFLNFACGVPPLQLALKPLLESNPPYKTFGPNLIDSLSCAEELRCSPSGFVLCRHSVRILCMAPRNTSST